MEQKEVTPHTNRCVVWLVFILTTLILILRYTLYILSYVRGEVDGSIDSSILSSSTMIELSTQVGGFLALSLSILGLATFFFFSIYLDESLLPAVMVKVPGVHYLGPCFLIAILTVLPIQAISLLQKLRSPRDHLITSVWILFVFLVTFVLTIWSTRKRCLCAKNILTLLISCAITSLISYLF